jgi:hypothetical protein
MSDGGYLAIILVDFCIDRSCKAKDEVVCPKFKSAKCDALEEKKKEFKDRLIIMHKKDVVDINLLKIVMKSMCAVCPAEKDCIKQGDFLCIISKGRISICIAAKDSILGMKAEGKYLMENS